MHDIALVKPFVGVAKGEYSIDQRNYMNFVEYFRGNMPLDSVRSPYSFRPVVPYVASFLPFEAMTSINVLNTFIIILTCFLVWFILHKLDFEFEYRILGGLLFIVSFPVFYYATTGYVDAAATMLIFAILALVLYEQYYLLIPAMILAALTKETCIVVFPFIFLYIYSKSSTGGKESIFLQSLKSLIPPEDKKLRNIYFFVWISFICFLVAMIIARKSFGMYGTGSGYLWLPSAEHLSDNVYRIKTYLSLILSMGFPGLLTMLYLISKKNKKQDALYVSLMVGIITALILWVYSYFSAYSDGRYIWAAYPYLIPLGLKYLKS
jgi:hypothetical protein